jgi:hypothetical protein
VEPRPNNPDAHGPWSRELPDLLRAAVGQLRDEAPPADACRRALDRARQIAAPTPPQPRPWPTGRISLFITGAVAAGLLAFFGWPHEDPLVVHHHRYQIQPQAQDRQTARAPRDASPSGVHAFGRPRVVLHGRGDPGQDVLPVTLGHLGDHWSEWERARALNKG